MRSALARAGHDVPRDAVVPYHAARGMLGRGAMAPDLVFVTCSPDMQQGIASLQQLRTIAPGKLIAVGSGTNAEQVLNLLRQGAYGVVDSLVWNPTFVAAQECSDAGGNVEMCRQSACANT